MFTSEENESYENFLKIKKEFRKFVEYYKNGDYSKFTEEQTEENLNSINSYILKVKQTEFEEDELDAFKKEIIEGLEIISNKIKYKNQ